MPPSRSVVAPLVAPRLVADAIACRRGERILLRGVSFNLAPGAALQLVGANGVGKSSLIRILAGLTRPYAGRVLRDGAVGLIDERGALDPALPLAAALGFWRRIDGAAAHQTALAWLGLGGLAQVPVRYLSTGQRRRAGFARLLGQRAALWLLDEPLNGLDHEAARTVKALTAEHCAGGGIAVIASHQPFAVPGLRRLELADHAPAEPLAPDDEP